MYFSEYLQQEAAEPGSRDIPNIPRHTPSACADTAPLDIMGRTNVTLLPKITQE